MHICLIQPELSLRSLSLTLTPAIPVLGSSFTPLSTTNQQTNSQMFRSFSYRLSLRLSALPTLPTTLTQHTLSLSHFSSFPKTFIPPPCPLPHANSSPLSSAPLLSAAPPPQDSPRDPHSCAPPATSSHAPPRITPQPLLQSRRRRRRLPRPPPLARLLPPERSPMSTQERARSERCARSSEPSWTSDSKPDCRRF